MAELKQTIAPPRKRKVRASVYLLLVHVVFLLAGQLFESETSGRRFFELVALFFLLSGLGRSLFVLVTVHGILSGADAHTAWLVLIFSAASAAVLGLTIYRIFAVQRRAVRSTA